MEHAIEIPQLWTPPGSRERIITPNGKFGVGKAAETLLPDLPKPVRRAFEILLMAGSKSFFLSAEILDHYLGAAAFTADATLYWGLWTSALADGSDGATAGEAAYTSYARVSQTNNATNFPAATGTTTATKSNGTTVTFPTSTGSSATVTYVGIFNGNAGTSDDDLYVWFDVSSTAIASGDTPKINAGDADFTED